MAKKQKKDKEMLEKIKGFSEEVYKDILARQMPEISLPLRSLSNVSYDRNKGYFEILGKNKTRTLSVNTVKSFAQSLRMINLTKELVEQDNISTKREAYYISKNWGDARFNEQPESLSCNEKVVVRINGKIKLISAKEVVELAFKKGKVIKKDKKVSVKELDLYSLSFDKNLRIEEHKIKYVHKHPGRKLINIVSASGREVAVTPFHSVFTMSQKGFIESKSASEITKKDYIAIPRKLKVGVSKKKIDLAKSLLKNIKELYVYFENSEDLNDYLKTIKRADLQKYVEKKYKNPVKRVIYQWKIHKSIPVEVFNLGKIEKKQNVEFGFPKGKTRVKRYIEKDANLGFVLGMLLSEGCHSGFKRKKNERRVSVSNNSKKLLIELSDAFKKTFGNNSLNNKPIKDSKKTYKLNIGYRLLSEILEKIFEYPKGIKSGKKKICSELFDAPEGCVDGFIRGFWLGDGSKNYEAYRIHSVSVELLEGINFLLLRKNIFAKLITYKRKKAHHQTAYELKISNTDSINRFSRIVEEKKITRKTSFSGDRIPKICLMIDQLRRSCKKKIPSRVTKLLDWYTMRKRNTTISRPTLKKVLNIFQKYAPNKKIFSLLQTYAQGDIYWDKVKKVISTEKPEYTMDFTVEPCQNFIGGKGLVLLHNSDAVMDDVEAMFRVNRERLGFIPEEKGGDVAGELIVVDDDPNTGGKIEIDCTKMGTGSYSVPSNVEHLQFKTKAKFILAIETAGTYQRLVKHAYWKKAKCILISMGGVPTRACRRFIRRLADDKKIPVYVFTDGDPYGYLNIYRTLKVGSGNAAHINKFFCVPQAKFIGVTPQDVLDYKLPTHPLKEVDFKRIKDGLKNDPFVQNHKEWQAALKQMEKMKKRVEQQAFAAHSLNYVIDTYLPEKMKNPKKWLP